MKSIVQILAAAALLAGALPSQADTTVTVNSASNWLGYMNVFQTPANGGGYVFGSTWGIADLCANFSGNTLTLSPNTVNDPDPFWYVGGGAPGSPGNKTMEANLYVEAPAGSLSGQTVTFNGSVLANTLTSQHTAIVFIKDFAPDYSSSVTVSAPLTPGNFSISLPTINDPGRHVQYGFQVTGPNVWVTDVGPFGNVQVSALVTPPNPHKTVDPTYPWVGYMNIFNLPAPDGDGQPYVPAQGSGNPGSGPWGVGDLRASFSGPVLTLSPNIVNVPGGLGNLDYYDDFGNGSKIMQANMYVEAPAGSLAGQTVTFNGVVTSNTLTSAHTAIAFIKEFDANYQNFTQVTAPLVNGAFSLSFNATNDNTHHVQWGFQVVGVNLDPNRTDLDSFGSVQITSGPSDPFVTWMGTHDFSAYSNPDLSKAGDPDGDGLNNFLEFALNGNPASGASTGKVRSRVETVGAEQALVLTLPVRTGAPVFSGSPTKTSTVDGIVYTIQGGNSLVNYDQTVTEVSPASSSGMPDPDAGWTYHTFRLDGAIGGGTPRGPLGFLRARIAPAP